MRRALVLGMALLVVVPATARGQTVARNQKVVSWEYFFDHDPGEGKGTRFPIQPPVTSAPESVFFVAPTSGSKTIYIRFQSSDSLWSGAAARVCSTPSRLRGGTIAYKEYWIGSDPGCGHGTWWSMTTGVISLPLERDQVVYVRYRDSFGRCSHAASRRYVYSGIRAAFYKYKCYQGTWSSLRWMSMTDHTDLTNASYEASARIAACFPESLMVQFQSDDYVLSYWFKALGKPGNVGVERAAVLAAEGGEVLTEGAYVPTHPEIDLHLAGQEPLDPGASRVVVDGQTVRIGGGELSLADGDRSLRWRPVLAEGDHELHACLVSASGLVQGETALKFTVTDRLEVVAPRVWPNPSRGPLHVGFGLTRAAEYDFSLYDVTGRNVFRSPRVRGMTRGNEFVWNGTSAGSQVPPGLYYYVLRARHGNDEVSTKGRVLRLQ